MHHERKLLAHRGPLEPPHRITLHKPTPLVQPQRDIILRVDVRVQPRGTKRIGMLPRRPHKPRPQPLPPVRLCHHHVEQVPPVCVVVGHALGQRPTVARRWAHVDAALHVSMVVERDQAHALALWRDGAADAGARPQRLQLLLCKLPLEGVGEARRGLLLIIGVGAETGGLLQVL